jgi:hypothetical protein
MRGAIPPIPQYVFMEWCLVKQRDNFTFTHGLGIEAGSREHGNEHSVSIKWEEFLH